MASSVEGLAEVVGQRVGGGDEMRAGLDLDVSVPAAALANCLTGEPAWCPVQRLTASAASTIVAHDRLGYRGVRPGPSCERNRMPRSQRRRYIMSLPSFRDNFADCQIGFRIAGIPAQVGG